MTLEHWKQYRPGAYASFQEGARLWQQAMAGVGERVPVTAQMHEFVAHELGLPATEFYTRPDVLVPAILAVQQAYGLDIASITFDVYNIEAEALGQKLVTGEDQLPDIDRGMPLIRDRADLALIKTPDFRVAGRFARVLEVHELFRELTGLEPTLTFCAPFTLAANLRGLEQLIFDIYVDPEFARDLLHRITEEVLAPWIRCQQERFPRAAKVSGADAVASLPLVNLGILRDWAAPSILRLRELCGPGVYVANWVGESYLSDPTEMLDLKRQVCPDFVEGQDPDVERLGPAVYRAYADEHRLPLVLGIGASFMAQATPEAVMRRVGEYLRAGAPQGRCGLYLCNLGPTTPPENVRAALQAARAYCPGRSQ